MYKRVLLKLSGEALAGEDKNGINQDVMTSICTVIKRVHDKGVQIAIVVGGGNFWRGKYAPDMEKSSADIMGMLATTMNGLALQDALEKHGVPSRVQTAFAIEHISEPFIQRKAVQYLEQGRVVIFVGGTGSPFFSTDTAAALRACEIHADAVLAAKNIDGLYTADPKEDPSATKIDYITFDEVLERNLKAMDLTAMTLCKENNIGLRIFGLNNPDNIERAINEESIGTIINNG